MRRAASLPALLAATLAAGSLAACGAPAAYDPGKVLRDAGHAMAGTTTVTANAAFGPGAQSFGFTLVSAHGSFHRPADSDTTVKARRGDAVVDFEVITLASRTYLKVPLLGWQDLTGSSELSALPDFGRLLDATSGLPGVLPTGTGATAMGHESVDGHDCYKLAAGFTADQVAQVITVLKPTGPIHATMWVDASSSLLRRIRLEGALYDSNQSSLDVHFRDFGAAVTIAKPV
ncbi:MAG TPA: LppX_LprAFG lipoprotein [Candidatus Dormibacteraeota bacterium]|nr:LppX_LprAFG lipoprotein [Candidatus Dormibacteraeota bacterium]